MDITLNNRPETFEQESLSISDVLKIKNYSFKMMVIKINGKLIRKPEYGSSFVEDGDDLQIIHMISGG